MPVQNRGVPRPARPQKSRISKPIAQIANTRLLLACGVAGSALFVGSFLIQGATREGYDPAENYVSSLSLGHGGWVMILTFLLTGILMAAFAIGLSRSMWTGRGSVWIPRLIGSFAVGVFLAGVFSGDPGQGYPPGEPERATLSWHAVGHTMAANLLYFSIIAAAVIYTIRFQEQKRTAWAIYTAVSAFVVFWALGAQPGTEDLGIKQRVGLITLFVWMAAIAARTRARVAR
jgi:hypothetical membrane protein